jgi:hypothetical protein
MPVLQLTPTLSAAQVLFLRNLCGYHERVITPSALSKEQMASFEQLQLQIKRTSAAAGVGGANNNAGFNFGGSFGVSSSAAMSRAGGPGPMSMSALPVAEVIDAVEDIEEC